MSEKETISTIERGDFSSSETIGKKIDEMQIKLNLVYGGIIGALILFGLNLLRENSFHTRVTELEREIANYRIEASEKINTQQLQILNLPNQEDIKSLESNIKNLKDCLKSGKYYQCF